MTINQRKIKWPLSSVTRVNHRIMYIMFNIILCVVPIIGCGDYIIIYCSRARHRRRRTSPDCSSSYPIFGYCVCEFFFTFHFMSRRRHYNIMQ